MENLNNGEWRIENGKWGMFTFNFQFSNFN